jgi:hypothetical protein
VRVRGKGDEGVVALSAFVERATKLVEAAAVDLG